MIKRRFSCGHQASRSNTAHGTSRGRKFRRCRTCYNRYQRRYQRRVRQSA